MYSTNTQCPLDFCHPSLFQARSPGRPASIGRRSNAKLHPAPSAQRAARSAQRAARNAHFAFATTLLILFLRPVPFKVYGDLMSTINSPFDIMPTKCAAPGYNFYDQEFAQTLGTPS